MTHWGGACARLLRTWSRWLFGASPKSWAVVSGRELGLAKSPVGGSTWHNFKGSRFCLTIQIVLMDQGLDTCLILRRVPISKNYITIITTYSPQVPLESRVLLSCSFITKAQKMGVSPSFWPSHVKAHGFSGLLQPCGSLGGKEPAGSCGETNLGGVTSWASVISDGMVVVKLSWRDVRNSWANTLW